MTFCCRLPHWLVLLSVLLAPSSLHGQYQGWKLPPGVKLPAQYLLEVTIPRFSAEKKPLLKVLRDLSTRYGIQFGVEVVVDKAWVEPRISLDLSNITLKDLINRIVRAARMKPAHWSHPSRYADLFHIVLGDTRVRDYPMNTMLIRKFSSDCTEFAATLIQNMRLRVPELKKFVAPGGIAGSMMGRGEPPQGICLYLENVPLRQLLDEIILRDKNVNWLFIFRKDAIVKSVWTSF